MVIHDKIALGSLAGVAASIPALIMDSILVFLGLAKFRAVQLSGGVFLFAGLTDSWQGNLLGALVWMIPAASVGVLVAYLIYATGKAYWWLKGLLVTLLVMYLIIYGFLFNLGGATIVPFDLATNLSFFLVNVVFGVTVGYLVVRWGPDTPELV